ncbi:MAG: cupin domain-containing protein [Rhodoferax sp.]|nr:cupin domain-containing protein [Rhodoferax sp.]
MNALSTPVSSADLVSALVGAHAQPLWDRYQRVTRRVPEAPDAPMRWSWQVMEPLIRRAVREVGMEEAERRVLLLTHPAFGGAAVTTTNLVAGLQTLLPGETARAHRHTIQALRFVMEGQGAVTSVNEHRCPMAEGDLILTPSWTWHEHTHPGEGRVVWFDGLDLPLCAHLDTMFFEMGGPDKPSVTPSPSRAAVWRSPAVTLAPDAYDLRTPGSSRYQYAWARAVAALGAAKPQADGSRLLRYVDGDSQGAVSPTLDCYLLRCAAGRSTRGYRSSSNAVCVVAQGEGSSRVGATTIPWKRHDVFTVPHWNWVSHTAHAGDALIFMMTDREFLASLGYLRDEEEPAA